MEPWTTQDHENVERIKQIVNEIPDRDKNESWKTFSNVKRPQGSGFLYVLAREIYANPRNALSERETIRALNMMVGKKEATIETKGGYIWYRVKLAALS